MSRLLFPQTEEYTATGLMELYSVSDITVIVLRIGKIIVLFSDTSMKFSMQVEFSLRNIFSYRAIANFSLEKIRAY